MQSSHADTSHGLLSASVNAASWSPQQQTARMLALCEAQMQAATQDADIAIDTLVHTFADLMGAIQKLGKLSESGSREGSQAPALQEFNEHCTALSKQAAAAVVAFQFYDKLSQRLGHVRYSLSTMALFICDRSNSQRPEHWDKLLTTLGRLYRTAEERAIFDSIAGSLSLTLNEPEQPLATALADPGSMELF